MKSTIIRIAITLFSMTQVYSGTILSSHGLGQPFDFPNARSLGMGELAIANPDANRIARLNPAALFTVKTTRLGLQYMTERTNAKDNTNTTNSNYSNFNGFQFATPLGLSLHLSFGITPLTRVSYNLAQDKEIEDITYSHSVTGSGGLNTLYLAAAWQPVPKISLGLKGSIAFGNISETWQVAFPSGSGFSATYDKVSTHYEGLGLTAGILYRPLDGWTIGAVYSSEINMDTKIDIIHIFNNPSEKTGSYTYPGFWGIGSSFVIRNKWLVGVDFKHTDWTRLALNDFPLPQTEAANQISVGVEKLANTLPVSQYLSRLPLRLGVTYKPYFSQDVNGNSISEKWITIGFGLPLFQNASHIDVAFGLGKRGSLGSNGIEENLMRLTLSLTGGEQWFIRRY